MRRSRDLALQTGLYLAAAISGVAAAYVLKEYAFHLWGSWSRDRRLGQNSDDKIDRNGDLEVKHEPRVDPPLSRPAGKEARSPTAASPPSTVSELYLNGDPTASPIPPSNSEPAVSSPRGETQPSVHAVLAPAQTRTLPPLCTQSLPPPPPNAQSILSGGHPDALSLAQITSPTTRSSSHAWSMVDTEGNSVMEGSDGDASQGSSPVSESLIEVLSPPLPRVVSRKRSMRSHDLFAASHISFSELGSLVSNPSQSD